MCDVSHTMVVVFVLIAINIATFLLLLAKVIKNFTKTSSSEEMKVKWSKKNNGVQFIETDPVIHCENSDWKNLTEILTAFEHLSPTCELGQFKDNFKDIKDASEIVIKRVTPLIRVPSNDWAQFEAGFEGIVEPTDARFSSVPSTSSIQTFNWVQFDE